MSYEVTATRRRPQQFDNLVGQEFVAQTLKNSIKSGKIVVYYGARLGRPPKNKLTQEEYNKRKRHYRNHYNK